MLVDLRVGRALADVEVERDVAPLEELREGEVAVDVLPGRAHHAVPRQESAARRRLERAGRDQAAPHDHQRADGNQRVVTETGHDFPLIWILVGSLNEAAN